MLRLDDGTELFLGKRLAKAGEGEIYDIASHPQWVAKIFHTTLRGLDAKRDKVKAMTLSPPKGAVQPNGFVVLTWPQHVITDGHVVAGYVMPKIDTARTVEIHALTNPTSRKSPHPNSPQWPRKASWKFLLNVAGNLCLAVETVHKVDAVIGDFQERNILVSDTSRVTLVDCDSMQFTEQSGRTFGCHVGRPEFSAPEVLRGHNNDPRRKSSDLFALAIHIHLLLMEGNHPFSRGKWNGTGDQPSISTLAHGGHWAGGPGSRLAAHPLAPTPAMLPPELRTLFVDAFTRGATNPGWRPDASQWRQVLMRMDAYTTTCSRDPSHAYSTNNTSCPWCVIDSERKARQVRNARRRSRAGGVPPRVASPTRARSPQGVRGGQPARYPPPPPSPFSVRGGQPIWHPPNPYGPNMAPGRVRSSNTLATVTVFVVAIAIGLAVVAIVVLMMTG